VSTEAIEVWTQLAEQELDR